MYSLTEIQSLYKKANLEPFRRVSGKEYNLNIYGIRNVRKSDDNFNDQIGIFWESSQWNHVSFSATTIPGKHYMTNPMTSKGTAILKPGRHSGMFKIGLHRGKYPALVQRKLAVLYRDKNKDLQADYTFPELTIAGINLHHAANAVRVGKYSAGCQVVKDPKDLEIIIALAEKSKTFFGDSFTYTLLEP